MVIVMLSAPRPSCKVGKPCRRNFFCWPLFLGCNGRAETWKFNYKKCSFLQLVCTKYEMFVEWLSWLYILAFVFQSIPLQYLWAISFPLLCLLSFSFLPVVKCSLLYLFNFLWIKIPKNFPSRCAVAKLKHSTSMFLGVWLLWNTFINLD